MDMQMPVMDGYALTLRFFDPRILRFFDPLIAQLFVSICIKKNSPVAI